MSKTTRRFRYIDGKVVEVTDCAAHKCAGVATKTYTEGNPLPSLSYSCHRDQVGEYREAAREFGIRGVEWDEQGNCSFTSRKGRKEWGNATHHHDDAGGYGD